MIARLVASVWVIPAFAIGFSITLVFMCIWICGSPIYWFVTGKSFSDWLDENLTWCTPIRGFTWSGFDWCVNVFSVGKE